MSIDGGHEAPGAIGLGPMVGGCSCVGDAVVSKTDAFRGALAICGGRAAGGLGGPKPVAAALAPKPSGGDRRDVAFASGGCCCSLGGMLKLLARLRGTYEAEWRFLCRASRSIRTNI